MCGVAFLDVDEREKSDRLGLGKNLGPLRHDSTTFLRCQGKWVYFGGVFGYFGALMGASGVTDVRCGHPGCAGDGMEWQIGSG